MTWIFAPLLTAWILIPYTHVKWIHHTMCQANLSKWLQSKTHHYATQVFESDLNILTKSINRLVCIIQHFSKQLDLGFVRSGFTFSCSTLWAISKTSSDYVRSTASSAKVMSVTLIVLIDALHFDRQNLPKKLLKSDEQKRSPAPFLN